MTDQSWDEQFKKFLQQTSEDFRRAGKDIRAEAQKLLDGAVDPDKQQKIRDRVNELGAWARKAAHGVAGAVEEAASKAQTALHTAAEKVTEKVAEMNREAPSSSAATPRSTAAAGGTPPKPSRAKTKPRTKKSGAKRKR